MTTPNRGLLTYLLLVFPLSTLSWAIIIHAGHVGTGRGLLVGVLMWTPAISALLACRILHIDAATLGWNWRPARFEAFAYILPLLYATPVYIACWLLVPHSFQFTEFSAGADASWGFPGFPRACALLLTIPAYATFGLVRSVASALGEEIGWRGFMLPRLTTRFGWFLGCLISGLIWACWHYPLLLFADYNSGTPKLFALTCFTLLVIGSAFQLAWLRLRAQSLWPCALLHGSHNLFIQSIFDRMTASTGMSPYVTTEFGFGMVLTSAITAYILWRSPSAPKAAALPAPRSPIQSQPGPETRFNLQLATANSPAPPATTPLHPSLRAAPCRTETTETAAPPAFPPARVNESFPCGCIFSTPLIHSLSSRSTTRSAPPHGLSVTYIPAPAEQ
jgi:membrane protease YdiL (CAAX protease family)